MHTPAKAMKGMVILKLHKSAKDPEIYYYFNASNEKVWMYRHKYYDSTGKRKEKKKRGFKSEKEALKSLLEVKVATIRGEAKQVEHDQMTVGEWLDTWYNTHKNSWKPTSRAQREMAIRLQMKPLLGHYKLQTLDRTTYKREFLNVLEKKYKPSTVHLFHTLFKIAINAAVEDEILSRNRFTKIKLSSQETVKKENTNYFTPEQLVEFLKVANREENTTNYTFLLTVAYTGIRRGEACGLQWKNIDFDNKTITIERTRDNKGIRSPKTKNSYRTILIDDVLVSQLKTYRKWCMEVMLSFGYKLQDESFVFTSYQTGKPITDSSVLYAFRRVLNKTNLPSITIHGLRHTHCTILLNQGLNVKVIAERLGNTPQMIYEIYGHVLKEMESMSVELFSQSLAESGAKFGAT
ncbi:tyrosine-type recombinase/integrase [Bacillus pacificus]|uniref:Site-specific integrase n=1 Tax=Bacillus pacificus TaxID=2026187 RepID=A0ABX6I7V5_9BACI|nr:recombinase XerC [Bacillus cereus]QHH89987.1 site-specific integrase [Bacillus pacificus]KXZ02956.1 recombinase XerC [Bacillus cereus]MBL3794012.1 site-specific integrase [Bacillus cereus]MBL3855972.1 site-specific integrase [Bacillus cereus]